MASLCNAKPTHRNVGPSTKQSGTDVAQQTTLRPVVNFRGTHKVASVSHRSRGKTERCIGWQRALAGEDYVSEVKQNTRCWAREGQRSVLVTVREASGGGTLRLAQTKRGDCLGQSRLV